jgi:hypothetical protein
MVVGAIRAQVGEFRLVGFRARVSGCWPRMDSKALSTDWLLSASAFDGGEPTPLITESLLRRRFGQVRRKGRRVNRHAPRRRRRRE